MTTTYTNSVSYLNASHWLKAEDLGYINEVLYGASLTGLIPIVPSSDFMRDVYMTRGQQSTKLTQQRRLNEEPDAKSGNPFKDAYELTALYDRRTDIDFKLAEHKPEVYDEMLIVDAQDMAQDIDYDLINGVPSADGYGLNGLENRIPITNTGYDVNNAAALTINTSATTFKTFLRLFRKAKDKLKVPPGGRVIAFCNESVDQAVSSGRDELGANVVGVGETDILNTRVQTIDQVPLIKLRTDSTGAEILPFDENSESSTSIWLCVLGGGPAEGSLRKPNGLVILSSNEVITRRTNQTLTQIQTLQEMEVGLRVPRGSVVRFSRLKVA
jgi:hypothetical protein